MSRTSCVLQPLNGVLPQDMGQAETFFKGLSGGQAALIGQLPLQGSEATARTARRALGVRGARRVRKVARSRALWGRKEISSSAGPPGGVARGAAQRRARRAAVGPA